MTIFIIMRITFEKTDVFLILEKLKEKSMDLAL
jgi:hypothetical protein